MQKTSPTNYSPLDEFRFLKISAFVGKAGSGKSWRAHSTAGFLGAEFIIDDGLLIRHSNIVLGKSAKTEKNQIRAIRRALFEYDDHRNALQNYFRKRPSASVMIIATSDEMAHRIAKRLGFPLPTRIVHIEEVSTKTEIEKARMIRKTKGQHVIPISHVFVSKNFASALVHHLRTFWRSSSANDRDKIIVRPPFSFYGEVHIGPDVLVSISRYIVGKCAQVAEISSVDVDISKDDSVGIDVGIKVSTGRLNIIKVSDMVRRAVSKQLSYMSGLDVEYVNVNVVGLEIR